MEFKLHSDYKPTGDQPEAIEKLVLVSCIRKMLISKEELIQLAEL